MNNNHKQYKHLYINKADGIRNGWDYYNVKIVDTRSTSTICAKFLVDDIYEFSLEQYAISLKNKFNVQDNHRVGAEYEFNN